MMTDTTMKKCLPTAGFVLLLSASLMGCVRDVTVSDDPNGVVAPVEEGMDAEDVPVVGKLVSVTMDDGGRYHGELWEVAPDGSFLTVKGTMKPAGQGLTRESGLHSVDVSQVSKLTMTIFEPFTYYPKDPKSLEFLRKYARFPMGSPETRQAMPVNEPSKTTSTPREEPDVSEEGTPSPAPKTE